MKKIKLPKFIRIIFGIRCNFPLHKEIKHKFDCSCGRELIVWTNNYGQGNTGMGRCECGASIYIN